MILLHHSAILAIPPQKQLSLYQILFGGFCEPSNRLHLIRLHAFALKVAPAESKLIFREISHVGSFKKL